MARVNAANPKTGEIVLSSIKKLMKNTGWTTRTIVKFIKMEYGVNSPSSRKISSTLKKGVRLGVLHKESGRYRLNDMSGLALPVTAREMRGRPRGRQQGVRLRSRSREPSHSPQRDRRQASPSPQRGRRQASASRQRDRRQASASPQRDPGDKQH